MPQNDGSIHASIPHIVEEKYFQLRNGKKLSVINETLVDFEGNKAGPNDNLMGKSPTEPDEKTDTVDHQPENTEDSSSEDAEGEIIEYIPIVNLDPMNDTTKACNKSSRIRHLPRIFDDRSMLSIEDLMTMERTMKVKSKLNGRRQSIKI